MSKEKDKSLSSSKPPEPSAQTSTGPARRNRIEIINLAIQLAIAVAAFLGVLITWEQLKQANEGIRELVTVRSLEVFDKVEAFSSELFDRRYLLHEFGGNAIVTCEEMKEKTLGGTTASRSTLKIVCEPWSSVGYGGVNFIGNDAITGRFRPLDLGKVRRMSFEFRYPKPEGKFFIRFKNARNFETDDIPIEAQGHPGTLQVFQFEPRAHPQIANEINNDKRREFLAMNISIATDFERYRWHGNAEIEFQNLQIEME
jgi:hypothetical protein